MAANVARKRHMRELKRKQAVAQQRKLQVIESSLGARARRAASAPILCCLLQGAFEDGAVDGGIASVVLARGRPGGSAATAVFLVDTFCLGIKDVLFHDLDASRLAELREAMSAATPVAPVAPELARKLLRDAAGWAAGVGFKPHRDFVAVEQIFGGVDADVCEAEFVFGLDGAPFYVPGPSETPAQVKRRFAQMIAYLDEDAAAEYALKLLDAIDGIEEDEVAMLPPRRRR